MVMASTIARVESALGAAAAARGFPDAAGERLPAFLGAGAESLVSFRAAFREGAFLAAALREDAAFLDAFFAPPRAAPELFWGRGTADFYAKAGSRGNSRRTRSRCDPAMLCHVASRTNADSVERVRGPSPRAMQVEEDLCGVRERFPGAIVGRYLDRAPLCEERVYVAPGAALVGRVVLREAVSVWYGCVLRADLADIEIRARSNVQDGAVVHVGDRDPVLVDEDVVVGHRAVLHGCTVGAGVLIGISATILDGAVIGEGSIVGAGSLVTAATRIPPRSLVLGIPGKVVKSLTVADEEFHRRLAGKYCRLAHNYREG
jgi:carbonic anhydrase/acetyltransferase-like protein (isoleucine patch superfamily)